MYNVHVLVHVHVHVCDVLYMCVYTLCVAHVQEPTKAVQTVGQTEGIGLGLGEVRYASPSFVREYMYIVVLH